MQLFFNNSLTEHSDVFQFEKNESRHISKVLRKSNGDILHITNGKGWMFEAQILEADIKSVRAKIIKKTFEKDKEYQLHMAVAPTKSMDRFEWFLEKATEIGVSEITPIVCDNSERKVIKIDRLERIVLSAVKQSLKRYIPKINNAISLDEFLKTEQNSLKYIAHCAEGNKRNLYHAAPANSNITILIGPEGDFSSNEIEEALMRNYQAVTLGNSRLRTETAALAACHTIALINALN